MEHSSSHHFFLTCLSSSLPANQVVLIDIELIADVLQKICILHQIENSLKTVRLGEGPGILQRDVNLQVSQVRTAKALDYVQLIGMRRASTQPGFIVEVD